MISFATIGEKTKKLLRVGVTRVDMKTGWAAVSHLPAFREIDGLELAARRQNSATLFASPT
ncbi:hypothetical protein AXG89_29170 (plasmid) [Burkholderia sp. PAMC 26561]|nr:hypothetical protein AXG89_23515 [Burkholderia sp. PAMC 26561]AME27909.1 hypothetical protein AXG89_29170 [Burkholderia sp. PAMC 26561]